MSSRNSNSNNNTNSSSSGSSNKRAAPTATSFWESNLASFDDDVGGVGGAAPPDRPYSELVREMEALARFG